MHHQADSVKLTEIVCTLPTVSKFFGQLVTCRNELSQALIQFLGKGRKISSSVVECVVLKEMLVNIWKSKMHFEVKLILRMTEYLGGHFNIEFQKLPKDTAIDRESWGKHAPWKSSTCWFGSKRVLCRQAWRFCATFSFSTFPSA